MNNLTRLACAVVLGLAVGAETILAAARPPAPRMVLVDDGVPPAPIIVPLEDPTGEVFNAANDLAGYVEKISGQRPEVLQGVPDPLPERAVWVGYQPVLKTFFPDLDFEFQHPEEILIAVKGPHLVITGRDREPVLIPPPFTYREVPVGEFGTAKGAKKRS